MLRIEKERDIEVLRQATVLLDRENQRLHERVQALHRELAELKGLDPSQLDLSLLKELEALKPRQASEQETSSPSEPSKPRRGHGPREQPDLPEMDVLHILDEEDLGCPSCGGQMEGMGEVSEDAWEVTVVQRQFVLARHRRKKYRCRCNGAVLTAPGPAKLIPGGRYSVEFAAEVASDKYLDHLPLERQARRMEREGLRVDSQTLWDQIEALARHLQPSYEELGKRTLSSEVLHVDETGWRMLSGKGRSKWSLFGLVTPATAYYQIASSKSTAAARKILAGFGGTVLADGYQVYDILSRAGPFTLAHCWAHVVRKYKALEATHPVECEEILTLLRKLYEIERLVPGGFPGDEGAQSLRRELREKRSKKVAKTIKAWCLSQGRLPRSALGTANRYVLKYWKGLTVFLEDPRVPLDNNPVERALRGPVVGRKNHYGSKSKRGTEVAGVLYSLCETAKLCGVEPKAYLIRAARAAIYEPGAVILPQPEASSSASAKTNG